VHLVAEPGDDAEVMGDHDQSGVGLRDERLEQLEDLRLDGDIECGGGLVGDQQTGSQARAMAIRTRCRMPPDS
jgi:hypothetical protein